MSLWTATGVAFLFTGILELLFCGLSLLGVLTGGVMTAGSLAGELRDWEALLGPLLLVFYALWLGITIISGPLHVYAGGAILAGNRSRKLLWAGTGVSILPLATVYCAPTSILAGVLGLVTALQKPEAA